MSFSATVVRVLVASPGDVKAERAAIVRVISEWNSINSMGTKFILLPVLWEKDGRPEIGDRPQALLNRQLVNNCDVLVAAFWTRIGTPTGVASSGTVEEIEAFRTANKPVLIYFSSKDVDLTRVNYEQYNRLQKYKNELAGKGIYGEYRSLDEFERLLLNHLSKTIQVNFGSPEIQKIQELEAHISKVNKKQIKDSFLTNTSDEDSMDLSKVKYEFHNQFRELEEFIRKGKENKVFPLDSIQKEASDVCEVISKIYNASPNSFNMISADIESLLKQLNNISTHKLYMDGGASYRAFWKKAEKTLSDFKAVIELM
jgi:hypothetical protein